MRNLLVMGYPRARLRRVMHRHPITITSIIIALVAVLCSVNCGDTPGECLASGGLFGPCVDGACDDGLQCFSVKSGEMCVPSSDLDGDPDVAACAAWRGDGVTCGIGICFVSCDTGTPDVCIGGTVCDATTEACVYPY